MIRTIGILLAIFLTIPSPGRAQPIAITSSFEFQRVATIGVEMAFDAFTYGLNVGGANESMPSRTMGVDSGYSFAATGKYSFPGRRTYAGINAGWQRFHGRSSVGVFGPGFGPSDFHFGITAIETSVTLSPLLGLQWLELDSFFAASEIGWNQAWVLNTEKREDPSNFGPYESANRGGSGLDFEMDTQTETGVYLVPLKVGYWL